MAMSMHVCASLESTEPARVKPQSRDRGSLPRGGCSREDQSSKGKGNSLREAEKLRPPETRWSLLQRQVSRF